MTQSYDLVRNLCVRNHYHTLQFRIFSSLFHKTFKCIRSSQRIWLDQSCNFSSPWSYPVYLLRKTTHKPNHYHESIYCECIKHFLAGPGLVNFNCYKHLPNRKYSQFACVKPIYLQNPNKTLHQWSTIHTIVHISVLWERWWQSVAIMCGLFSQYLDYFAHIISRTL